jgi:hypothetical protein
MWPTSNLSASSGARRKTAKPVHVRTVDLEAVLQRAEVAFDACVRESQGELLVLIHRLIAIDTAEKADYEAASLREVLRCANDLRGVALTLGSESVAEVADAIFEFAEAVPSGGRLPKPLIVLLARCCLRLVAPSGEPAGYHAQVQALLAEARTKLLGEPSA